MLKKLCFLIVIAGSACAFAAVNEEPDGDGDGVKDYLDRWPQLYAAAVDRDYDGAPDHWTEGCNEACKQSSGLVLDAFLGEYFLARDENKNGLPDAYSQLCNHRCREEFIARGIIADVPDWDQDGILDNVDVDDNHDLVADADSDSNGLIDIYTVDQLNAIRFSLDGYSRKMSATDVGDSSGCPLVFAGGNALTSQCHGYELKNPLNFDTNSNGRFDAEDTYWNGGKGWTPIDGTEGFKGLLEGNGFAINNLTINNGNITGGLFKRIYQGSVRNLALVDFNIVDGAGGPLADYISNGHISGIFTRGKISCVENSSAIAGLARNAVAESIINNVLIATDISCERAAGFGLLIGGYGLEDASLNRAILVLGQINSINSSGISRPAIAYQGLLSASYWARDLVSRDDAGVTGASGVSLAQLKCPNAANNTSCAPGITLYENWDLEKNSAGDNFWVFSSGQQLPALKLNNTLYSYQPELEINQAPKVQLQYEKNPSTAADGSGYFTLRAVVSDANALNVHAIKWNYGALRPSKTLRNAYEFFRPAPGKYTVSVTVTDSGLPALTSAAQIELEFKEDLAVVPPTEPKPATGIQAGAINFAWLVLLSGLMVLRRGSLLARRKN